MLDARVQRRLAAIVAADIAGYSRLMAACEEETHARVMEIKQDIVRPKSVEFGGRVVKTTGDGALIEFASVVNAVDFAIAMQEAVSRLNEKAEESSRILFRIGINIGDVMVDDDDLYGDGVNVAARLEGIAEAGGITISQSVYEYVRNRNDISFEDLGEPALKNIVRPVRVYRVLKAGAGRSNLLLGHHDDNLHAVAVLPFVNMSGDGEQEFFADGLTEDITTALALWRSFPVVARNSAFAYKGRSLDLKQVGRELGARYLLEGSVRKAGQRVRVTAQLIDAEHGHHLWAERYDRQLDDIFELQDEIVQRIVAIVAPHVIRIEAKRPSANRAGSLSVWELCLRANATYRQRTKQANEEARALFRQACELDPGSADAHAGISRTHHLDIMLGNTDDRMATAQLALDAAQKAVTLDSASAHARLALSTAYQWLDRHDEAVREARISVELNPYDADMLHSLGNKSDLAGDPHGVAYMEKAQQLNPQDAQRHAQLAFLARAYFVRGDFARAAECARQSIERHPTYPNAHYMLALALAEMDCPIEAKAAIDRCSALHPGFPESRKTWHPYVQEEKNRLLRQGLQKLGL